MKQPDPILYPAEVRVKFECYTGQSDTLFGVVADFNGDLVMWIKSRKHPRRKAREIWRGKPSELIDLGHNIARVPYEFARLNQRK